MDYKQMLIDIINQSKTSIFSQEEYVKAETLLKKIDFVVTDFIKINSFNDDDLSLFFQDKSRKFVGALQALVVYLQSFEEDELFEEDVYDMDEIRQGINALKTDIIDNVLRKYIDQIQNLDDLYDIVMNDKFLDNYELIFDFIKSCYESSLISITDAVNLNFYILNECSNKRVVTIANVVDDSKLEDEEIESVMLEENAEDVENKLREIFGLYGYDYDSLDNKMKFKFNKYVKPEYLDYILYKFNYYGIASSEIRGYSKTLFRLLISNDRDSFDMICKFIDQNGCSLRYLLTIPSIFARKKRKYIPRNFNADKDNSNSVLLSILSKDDKDFEVDGSFDYFFKNVELYKRLNKKDYILDEDLMKSAKFFSTPSVLIEKNLKLLLKYKIVSPNDFPSSAMSLCGVHTEYLIDRFIEAGLYEVYLSSISKGSKPRGASYLSFTNRPFKFYKIKRANDLGESIMASNGGIRREFNDDDVNYFGMYLSTKKRTLHQAKEKENEIVQEPIAVSVLEAINPSIRKRLSNNFYWNHNPEVKYSLEESAILEFNNLYKYRTYSPLDIFPKDDLRGEIIEKIFTEDFKNVDVDSSIEEDEIVKLFDQTIYTDKNGEFHQLKTTDFKYEFSNPEFSNLKVVISRQKVLRLLSLLKQKNVKIDNLTGRTKIDVLLSVVLKDTIISDYEKTMVRYVIGLIVDKKLNFIGEFERGVRRC